MLVDKMSALLPIVGYSHKALLKVAEEFKMDQAYLDKLFNTLVERKYKEMQKQQLKEVRKFFEIAVKKIGRDSPEELRYII